jgi:hypothetical protein
MRIALYDGSTVYPLAGEAGVSERVHSSAGDLQITPEAEMQVASRVRAGYAQPIDRGNVLHTISFATVRKFATVAAAQEWALDYEETFPRSGTLHLQSISAEGVARRRIMANAVVSPPQRTVTGLSVRLSYQVRGGEISTQAISLVVSGCAGSGVDGNGTVAPQSTLTNGRAWWLEATADPKSKVYHDGNRWVIASLTGAVTLDLYRDNTAGAAERESPLLVSAWTAVGTPTGAPAIEEA